MDVVKAVETYVNRLVSEPSGMKVLILDTHTVRSYGVPGLSCSLTSILDTHSFSSINAVLFTCTRSVSNRPY
jgi:hypothetical protein